MKCIWLRRWNDKLNERVLHRKSKIHVFLFIIKAKL